VRITKIKESILSVGMSKMMGVEVMISYDIILIVNYGWSGSFANTTNNVKAILVSDVLYVNYILTNYGVI
jgi:hypothetical protein